MSIFGYQLKDYTLSATTATDIITLGFLTGFTGTNVVPLTGTLPGQPITGNFKVHNNFDIYTNSGKLGVDFVDDDHIAIIAQNIQYGWYNETVFKPYYTQFHAIDPDASSIEGDVRVTTKGIEVAQGKILGHAYVVPTDDTDYVQKKYVDDVIASGGTGGGSYIAENGIIITDNVIALGGTLTDNIAISSDGNQGIELGTASNKLSFLSVDTTAGVAVIASSTTDSIATFSINPANIQTGTVQVDGNTQNVTHLNQDSASGQLRLDSKHLDFDSDTEKGSELIMGNDSLNLIFSTEDSIQAGILINSASEMDIVGSIVTVNGEEIATKDYVTETLSGGEYLVKSGENELGNSFELFYFDPSTDARHSVYVTNNSVSIQGYNNTNDDSAGMSVSSGNNEASSVVRTAAEGEMRTSIFSLKPERILITSNHPDWEGMKGDDYWLPISDNHYVQKKYVDDTNALYEPKITGEDSITRVSTLYANSGLAVVDESTPDVYSYMDQTIIKINNDTTGGSASMSPSQIQLQTATGGVNMISTGISLSKVVSGTSFNYTIQVPVNPTYPATLKLPNTDGTFATEEWASTALGNKANLASPSFSGTPTSTTPVSTSNNTQIATTAFVKGQNYALLTSPIFSGTPSLPTGTNAVTQSTSDNSTKLATTAFVKSLNYSANALTTGGYITDFQTDVITAGPGGGGSILLGYDSQGIAIIDNAVGNVGFIAVDQLTGDRTHQLPDSSGTLLTTGINILPTYSNNASAISGGLSVGQIYKTATGELRIVV